MKIFEIFQVTESEIHFTQHNTFFLPNFTENYEKTTGNPENSIFTENSKIRFLKFYEKINLLEFTRSDWKFSKSGNNNLVEFHALSYRLFGDQSHIQCIVRQPISGLGYGRGYLVTIASLTAV